jgi:hypothetical protein
LQEATDPEIAIRFGRFLQFADALELDEGAGNARNANKTVTLAPDVPCAFATGRVTVLAVTDDAEEDAETARGRVTDRAVPIATDVDVHEVPELGLNKGRSVMLEEEADAASPDVPALGRNASRTVTAEPVEEELDASGRVRFSDFTVDELESEVAALGRKTSKDVTRDALEDDAAARGLVNVLAVRLEEDVEAARPEVPVLGLNT